MTQTLKFVVVLGDPKATTESHGPFDTVDDLNRFIAGRDCRDYYVYVLWPPELAATQIDLGPRPGSPTFRAQYFLEREMGVKPHDTFHVEPT